MECLDGPRSEISINKQANLLIMKIETLVFLRGLKKGIELEEPDAITG